MFRHDDVAYFVEDEILDSDSTLISLYVIEFSFRA